MVVPGHLKTNAPIPWKPLEYQDAAINGWNVMQFPLQLPPAQPNGD